MLRTLFVFLIFVPGFYAALRNRYAALLMYVWFALFRPQDWLWIDITSLRLSSVLAIVMLAPAIVSGTYPNVAHPLSLGMIGFIATSLLSQTTAVNPALGWVWVDFMTRLVVTCLLAVTLVSTRLRLAGLIAVIGGSLGVHAAKAGLVFLLGGGTRFADGLAGAFVDNNGYALGTAMVMPLLLVTAQNVESFWKGRLTVWIRTGFYLAVPLCAFTVVGTYSRGGFLALAAAGLVYVLLQRKRVVGLTVLGSCVALVLLVAPIPDSYVDRLSTIRTYQEIGEDSALSRPHFWRVGMQMGLRRPLGVGLRQYESAYDSFDFLKGRFGTHRAVHNAHVQVFAELGPLGAIVWLALFAYATFACLRVRARSRDERLTPEVQHFLFTTANGLLVSMTAFVVGGMFLSVALNDLTWLTFAAVAALDRISYAEVAPAPVRVPQVATRQPALAFRAVDTYASGSSINAH